MKQREPNFKKRLGADLPRLLAACLRRWPAILAGGLLLAAVFTGYVRACVTPLYRAGVMIYVDNQRQGGPQTGYISAGDLASAQRLVATYVAILRSDTVLDRVIGQAGLDCTAGELRARMTAAQVDETELFRVYVLDPDPARAAQIANAVADVAPGAISGFLEGSSARVVDRAEVPRQRYSPSYARAALTGGAAGCALALLALLAAALTDVRAARGSDLTGRFPYPLLGQIPDMAGTARRKGPPQEEQLQEERLRIQGSGGASRAREAYKALRTNVTFSLADEAPCKVLAVTSALQSEGKSLTALNLALSFAEMERRVLLVDCDLRRPKLSRLLGLRAPTGLSGILTDPEGSGGAILPGPRPGLHILPAGEVPPGPSELLASARFRQLVGKLREKYDYILLDTPPVGVVTDACVLAPVCSGVLFVVRAGVSDLNAVGYALGRLEYARAKILGFVFNCARPEKSERGWDGADPARADGKG